CEQNINALGSARGRLGWSFGRLMIYGTGGLAVADRTVQTFLTTGGPVPPSGTPTNGQSYWQMGWTAGAGAEYALASQWSAKLEYAYYSFGNHTSVVDGLAPVRTTEHENILKLGINYHFAAPPPPPPMAAPMPAAAPAPAPAMARTFLVFFDFDKYNLTPDARRVIEAAAQSYKATGSARIDVSGYTDLAGTQAYNLRLSQRRADAVAAYLEKQGVPKSALDVKWFGKEHPRVPTPDGVREPQNRRVEIVMP